MFRSVVLIQLIRIKIRNINETPKKKNQIRERGNRYCVCVRFSFTIKYKKGNKVSNRTNQKWNREIISWFIGKRTSENIKSNRNDKLWLNEYSECFMKKKKEKIITRHKIQKMRTKDRKKQSCVRIFLATRNKLMTDHLSFLMIRLRQNFGISIDVLAILSLTTHQNGRLYMLLCVASTNSMFGSFLSIPCSTFFVVAI